MVPMSGGLMRVRESSGCAYGVGADNSSRRPPGSQLLSMATLFGADAYLRHLAAKTAGVVEDVSVMLLRGRTMVADGDAAAGLAR